MEPTENASSPTPEHHQPSAPPLPPLLSDEADVLTLEAEPEPPEPLGAPPPALSAHPGHAGAGAIFTLRESLPWQDPGADIDSVLGLEQAVLVAPTGIDGLDRLLGGGLHLTPRGQRAAAPSVTVALSGPPASGKTVLALHLAAAVCRAHRRGAALCLAPEGTLGEVRGLLRAYGEAGFSWVSTLGGRSIPAVAAGLVLAPAGPGPGAHPLLQQLDEACAQLPRELPLRAVLLDGVAASDAERAALADALGEAGTSLVLVDGGAELPRADLRLELGFDEEAHGPVLRVRGARRSPAHPEASLLSLSEGTARVMPPASLYPALCRQAPGLMRGLPLSRFGDPTLDKRAGDRPWLRPQARVLMQGPDPACLLLLANRFLAEAPQRLAMFFGGAAARGPQDEDRGVVHLRRARTGAEVVAQVCEALGQFRQRWPRALMQAPRVALIDPAGLYADGRLDTSGPVLDAALLSVCSEAGVMALMCRTASDLVPWWSDYDLVLHLPQRTQGGVLTVRVVVDRL